MKKQYMLLAINAEGKSVYIDDVPNGAKCNCHCADCGGELIAKNNGKIKHHHFAHANGNDSLKCSQTALHLLAKEIIAEEKMVPIPRNNTITFYKADSVEQEKYMEDIRPDIYATCEDRPFIVEILVTHETDEDKQQKIAAHKVSAVEIDLSEMNFNSKEDVKNALFNPQNIKILYDDDERMISERKDALSKFGLTIQMQRGGIILCPYIKRYITRRFCEECVFCYSEKKEYIKCGMVMSIVVNDKTRNTANIIANQNKVMFPSEAKRYNDSHFSNWKVNQAIEHAYMSQMLLR
ncbi:MAG: hypothetical protein IKN82_02305 [Treponema sp.]|nr:hypothetical protein [Treponema sp.]